MSQSNARNDWKIIVTIVNWQFNVTTVIVDHCNISIIGIAGFFFLPLSNCCVPSADAYFFYPKSFNPLSEPAGVATSSIKFFSFQAILLHNKISHHQSHCCILYSKNHQIQVFFISYGSRKLQLWMIWAIPEGNVQYYKSCLLLFMLKCNGHCIGKFELLILQEWLFA